MKIDELEELIRKAYKQQNHSKCIELIESAPENVKSSSRYKIIKASCLNITGKSVVAHDLLDEVIQDEPNNAFALYGKGLVFMNESKLVQALTCFEAAIRIDPSEKMKKARLMKLRAEELMKTTKSIKHGPATKAGPTKHCDYCNQDFPRNFSLKRHILVHTGEKPHKCQVCGYGFIQKSDLVRHMTTHSTAMDYKCDRCHKLFKTQKNLHCHLATHSNVTLFNCSWCRKPFKLERTLKLHEQLHEQQFECKICKKKLASKLSLENHCNKCHVPIENKARGNKIKAIRTQKVNGKTNARSKTADDFKMPFQIEGLNDPYPQHGNNLSENKSELTIETPKFKVDHFKSSPIIEIEKFTLGDMDNKASPSDMGFSLSLLKELGDMTEAQKVRFKTRTLSILDEILM